MDIKPIRRKWRGTTYDSQLESDWAATFVGWNMEHVYHPGSMQLSNGEYWEPDFVLDGDILFEVKGGHNERIHKPHLAIQMGFNVIIGRAGIVPAGSDIGHAGAVWEPTHWVVTRERGVAKFVNSRKVERGSVLECAWSGDVAVRGHVGGIRWFKAVGDDNIV